MKIILGHNYYGQYYDNFHFTTRDLIKKKHVSVFRDNFFQQDLLLYLNEMSFLPLSKDFHDFQ